MVQGADESDRANIRGRQVVKPIVVLPRPPAIRVYPVEIEQPGRKPLLVRRNARARGYNMRVQKMNATDKPWTPEEDSRLSTARASGMKWLEVATVLPGRTTTAASSRHRYLVAMAAGTYQRGRAYAPGMRTLRADAVTAAPIDASATGLSSDKLRVATDRLYQREAKRRGVSLATVIISMQQGPEAAALWQAKAA